VEILDSTLRDGKQGLLPKHASLRTGNYITEAVKYSKLSSAMGVSYFDAGVAVADDGGRSKRLVEYIAREHKDDLSMSVLGFTPAREQEIAKTIESVSGAGRRGLAILVSLSYHHMPKYMDRFPHNDPETVYKHMLAEFTDRVGQAGRRKERGDIQDIHVYLEDASRMTIQELVECTRHMVSAGATSIAYPDTLGKLGYGGGVRMFRAIHEHAGQYLENTKVAVHCHDDIGFAVPHTVGVLRAGLADIAEVTFGGNGPGEGPGNTDGNALLYDLFPDKDDQWHEPLPPHMDVSHLHPELLYPLNMQASRALGRLVPENAKIVGSNANRKTSAGIHATGSERSKRHKDAHSGSRQMYSMYRHDRSRFSVPDGHEFAVDRWSSQKTLLLALRERNIPCENLDIKHAHANAIRIAYDTSHTLTDSMLATVAWDAMHPPEQRRFQVDFNSFDAKREHARASVKFSLRVNGEEHELLGNGTGELSAFIDAMNTYFVAEVGHRVDVDFHDPFSETAVTKEHTGRDADTYVEIILAINGDKVEGFGFDADEVISGCRASLQALNRWYTQQPSSSSTV
jgi:isopropylmalate/homocitrate/citramalate synthase